MIAVLRFLFVIPIGFVAACFAAAAALLWPFLDVSADAFQDPFVVVELVFGFLAQAAQVGSIALIPWALFMVISEIWRLDSLLLHAVLGVVGGLAGERTIYGGGALSTSVEVAFLVAGLAFALVYWIVAGRAAGHWRRRSENSLQP